MTTNPRDQLAEAMLDAIITTRQEGRASGRYIYDLQGDDAALKQELRAATEKAEHAVRDMWRKFYDLPGAESDD